MGKDENLTFNLVEFILIFNQRHIMNDYSNQIVSEQLSTKERHNCQIASGMNRKVL